MTKRIIALLLSLIMVLALFSGCQEKNKASDKTGKEDAEGKGEEKTPQPSQNTSRVEGDESDPDTEDPGNDTPDSSAGALDEKQIRERVGAAMDGVTSVEMVYNVPLEATISTSGFSMTYTMNMDFVIETILEPEATHLTGTVSLSFMGNEQEMHVEAYKFTEDDTEISYTWDESAQTFYRTVEPKTETESEVPGVGMIEDEHEWTVEEHENEYILSCKMTEEDMKTVFSSLDGSAEGVFSFDELSETEPLVIYMTVDKDTMLVKDMSIDLSSVFVNALKSNEQMESFDIEGSCPATFTFRNYNEVEPFSPPTNYVDGQGSNT